MLPAKPTAVMSANTRIFLSYAVQDANYRSLLIGAAKAARLPVQFVEMPNHVSDAGGRQALCRARLQQCDLAIVLQGRHTATSLPVESDLDCVRAGGLPLHAVLLPGRWAESSLPPEWGVASWTGWNWPEIAPLLHRCDREPLRLRAAS
jgi:hypothetical protein